MRTSVSVVVGVGGRRGRKRRRDAAAVVYQRGPGYRCRRQLARQRRRERDRLVRLVHRSPGSQMLWHHGAQLARAVAIHLAKTVGYVRTDLGWALRSLIGSKACDALHATRTLVMIEAGVDCRLTDADRERLIAEGFPLHAGLRGKDLAAYRHKTRARRWRDSLSAALENFSSNGAAMLPETAELKVEWPKPIGSAGGEGLHQALCVFMADEMSKAVLGQTLTTGVCATRQAEIDARRLCQKGTHR